MYDMYPDYSPNPDATAPLTHRASEAELKRWAAQGAEVTDVADYVDAHAVREAQQVLSAQRPLGVLVTQLAEVRLG